MKAPATALGLIMSLSLTTACMAAEAGEKEMEVEQRVSRIDRDYYFLKEFDADGDGKVSRKEFEAEWDGRLDAEFEDFDANKDGFVTRDEFTDEIQELVGEIMKGVSVKLGRALGRLDHSFDFDFDFDFGDTVFEFDGVEFGAELEEQIERAMRHAERGMRHAEHGLRRAERRMKYTHHRQERLLEEYDENENGELDPDELEKIRQAHKEMMEARKKEMEEHKALMKEHRAEMKKLHQAFGEKMKERRRAALAELDTDGNGKISRDEFNQRLDGRFEELDKNGDGELSEDEMEGAQWAFGRSWHPRVVVKLKE